MKTLGIGVDIVENKRILQLIKKKQFISRVFSIKEISNSKKIKNKTNYFAKRFAAKEALSKALGIGFRKGLNFKDISIDNDKFGKPYYELNKYIKKLIYFNFKTKIFKISLSLSDEKNYSIAFAIISAN